MMEGPLARGPASGQGHGQGQQGAVRRGGSSAPWQQTGEAAVETEPAAGKAEPLQEGHHAPAAPASREGLQEEASMHRGGGDAASPKHPDGHASSATPDREDEGRPPRSPKRAPPAEGQKRVREQLPMFGPKRPKGRPRRHVPKEVVTEALAKKLGIDWKNPGIVGEEVRTLSPQNLVRLSKRQVVNANGTAIAIGARAGNTTTLVAKKLRKRRGRSDTRNFRGQVHVNNPWRMSHMHTVPPPDPGGGGPFPFDRSQEGADSEGGGDSEGSVSSAKDSESSESEGEDAVVEQMGEEIRHELMCSQGAGAFWGYASGRGIPPVDGAIEGEMYSILLHLKHKLVVELKHDSPGWIRFCRPYPNGTVTVLFSTCKAVATRAPFNELRAPKVVRKLWKAVGVRPDGPPPSGMSLREALREKGGQLVRLGNWRCEWLMQQSDSEVVVLTNEILGSQLYLTGEGFLFSGNEENAYWLSGNERGRLLDAPSCKRLLLKAPFENPPEWHTPPPVDLPSEASAISDVPLLPSPPKHQPSDFRPLPA